MSRLRNDLEARKPYLDPDFSDAEYDRRLEVVRAGMARDNLDALIVYCGAGSSANARWLTNFQPVSGSTFVVVRADGGITMVTDGVLHAEPMHSGPAGSRTFAARPDLFMALPSARRRCSRRMRPQDVSASA